MKRAGQLTVCRAAARDGARPSGPGYVPVRVLVIKVSLHVRYDCTYLSQQGNPRLTCASGAVRGELLR